MTGRPCPWCRTGNLRVTQFLAVYQCDSCRTGTVGPRRIVCLVPFCRRSRGDRNGDPLADGVEWICSRHWSLVPRRLKRRRAMLRRMERRAGPERLARIEAADHRTWAQCKVAAIEASVGIG